MTGGSGEVWTNTNNRNRMLFFFKGLLKEIKYETFNLAARVSLLFLFILKWFQFLTRAPDTRTISPKAPAILDLHDAGRSHIPPYSKGYTRLPFISKSFRKKTVRGEGKSPPRGRKISR